MRREGTAKRLIAKLPFAAAPPRLVKDNQVNGGSVTSPRGRCYGLVGSMDQVRVAALAKVCRMPRGRGHQAHRGQSSEKCRCRKSRRIGQGGAAAYGDLVIAAFVPLHQERISKPSVSVGDNLSACAGLFNERRVIAARLYLY
jgi:hypothetical protein